MEYEDFMELEARYQDPSLPSGRAKAFAKCSNDFAAKLWPHLSSGNQVVSPVSISFAFAMLYRAAQGQTREELQAVFAFDERSAAGAGDLLQDWRKDIGSQLRVANRLFGLEGYPWAQTYLDSLKDDFGAPLEEMDFPADPEGCRRRINEWVEAHTGGMLRDALPSGIITEDTAMTLANAVFFDGAWDAPFKDELTKERPFYLGGEERSVPTMNQTRFMGYGESPTAHFVYRDYDNGRLSFCIAVPKDRDGLAQLEAELPTVLQAPPRGEQRKVDLFLPRFELSPDALFLKKALATLGLRDIFDDDRADLTGAQGREDADPLCLSSVIHKARIEVSEEGTKAAAVTFANVAVAGAWKPPPPIEVRADRPFLFFIREVYSNAIVFMGRVEEPWPNESAE